MSPGSPDPRDGERRPAPGQAQSLFHSLTYAFEGVIHVLRTQRNMRVHFGIAIAVQIVGLALGATRAELIALLVVSALVIVAEMINTAVEATVDIATTSFDPRAKIAKDVSAGAVLVCAFIATIVAYLVFADRLANPSSRMLTAVRESPTHLSVIALVLTVIIVIAVKAWTGRGSPLRGGLPSGHAAVAFGCWASILFITSTYQHHVLIATLGFVMAALVAQTRVEAGIHTTVEVVYGAVVGVLVVLVIFQVWS